VTGPIRVATSAFEGTLDPDENLRRLLAGVDEAAGLGAQLVVFPECALQGYPTPARREAPHGLLATWADAEDVLSGPRTTALRDRAIERGIHVVYGLTERTRVGGVVYNTAVLTGPDGHIGAYRKVHLGNHEQRVWRRGDAWPVFETAIGNIGMLICIDKAWPESTRELVLGGADILVMPTAWGFDAPGTGPADDAWADIYLHFDRVRAMENTRWFIGSNFAGSLDGDAYPGFSQIIDPVGRVLATTGTTPGFAVADIDVRGGIEAAQAMWFGPRQIRERRDDTYRILRGEAPIAIDG
jgi:predicted amidohydrolase